MSSSGRRRALAAAGFALAVGVLLVATDPGLRSGAPDDVRPPGDAAADPPAARAGDTPAAAVAPAGVPADTPAASLPPAAARRGGVGRVGVGRAVRFPPDAPRSDRPLAETARALLREHAPALGIDAMPGELRLDREFRSLSAHHLRLRQFVNGAPVEGSQVAVHVALDGRPLLAQADLFPVEGVADAPTVTADAAVAAVRDLLADAEPAVAEDDEDAAADLAPPDVLEPVLVVLPEGRRGALAWRVDVRTEGQSSRIWIDATDGDALLERDLRRAAEGRGVVFRPNPVLSRKDGTLEDGFDAPSAALDAELVVVELLRLDGSGLLRGAWADATPDRFDPARPGTLDWTDLDRSLPGFESVNAYHHVDRTQEKLQSLGFTDVNASPQKIVAHGTKADQSYYDTFGDRLVFGDGGVDDAEDGDIVVHEVGHAIQDDQVRDYGTSSEGAAMGEGFSDYLAATLHATGDPAWDPLVASWDATSYSPRARPYLRRVDEDKIYPHDLVDEPHADGEIWSRFLWDLNDALGADEALRLVVESHFYLTANARFLQGANALLLANRALRDGADDAAIRALLRERGLPFDVPSPSAPDEDPYEDNDDAGSAAPLAPGVHTGLLLADDDWFRVAVAPLRRLHARATFDPDAMDLDLEVRTDAGVLVDLSEGVGGSEEVDATAGRGGAVFLVRARHTPHVSGVAGYTLTLVETELPEQRPGRTDLRRILPGATAVFSVPVAASKSGRRLVVASSSRGLSGAVNDVRITSPEGDVFAEAGEGRTARGARVVVGDVVPGAWVVEVAPRDGSGGRYKLRAVYRR